MKLKIRYEDRFQTLELEAADVEQLWITLSLEEEEGISEQEKEERIQEAFDVQFNRPDYNNWHKHNRRTDPTPKRKKMNGRAGYIQAEPGDDSFDIMDYLLTASDDEGRDRQYDKEAVVQWVKEVLEGKSEWIDAFIAVRIEGEPVREYAARIGVSENSVSQKLRRAEKRLKEMTLSRMSILKKVGKQRP